LNLWAAYIETRGPLSDGLRMEYLFARLSTHIAQAVGNETAKVSDYLRYHGSAADDQQIADITEVAKIMGAKQVNHRGK